MTQARKSWLTVHRWVGLLAGIFFVVMGLSGSFLVFYQEIDAWLNPAIAESSVAAETKLVPIQRVLDAVNHQNSTWFLHSVFPPNDRSNVYHVWFIPKKDDGSKMREVLVDAYSVKVLGSRNAVPTIEFAQNNIANTIYTLHYQLFIGEFGTTVVGIIGLFLLFSTISGIVIWWPKGKNWAVGLKLKQNVNGIRRYFDLHRTFGIYSVVFLMMLAFTGVFISLTSYLTPIVSLFSSETPADNPAPNIAPANYTAINADASIAIAKKVFPQGVISCLWLPGASSNAWRVTLKLPNAVGMAGGDANVWIDPATGKVLAKQQHSQNSAGKRFMSWQLPLHDGSVLGLFGRVIVFIAGLVPLVLAVTGFNIWLKKRQARKAIMAKASSSY